MIAMTYDASGYPSFAVTVDLVVLTLREGELCALLIRRGVQPYVGKLALPGGFILEDEDIETAAYRELQEEVSVGRRDVVLEQLRTYGAPERDPRMRVVSVAWLALGANLPEPTAGSDAAEAFWMPVQRRCADRRSSRSTTPRSCATAWTERAPNSSTQRWQRLSVLRSSRWGSCGRSTKRCGASSSIRANFHRKVTGAEGFLIETGERTTRAGGRPAMLYRAGPAEQLHPPILRTAQ